MFVSTNTVNAIIQYYKDNLAELYASSEIKSIIELMFEKYMDWPSSKLWLSRSERLSESDLLNFHFALKRLLKGEPVQQVIGYGYFYQLKFKVNASVLIPRPETEELVEWIVKETIEPARILDIGTGSGCISIALKNELKACDITGVDISAEAIELARENATANRVEVAFATADVFSADFTSQVGGKWDIIVSNPPYIPLSEKENMDKNVVEYEPHLALFVPDLDPLIFYNQIADLALTMLVPNGKLYFEISNRKGEEVVRLLREKGFKNVILRKDINDNDRMVAANI
jgi:release factor glutamine methyltransferase